MKALKGSLLSALVMAVLCLMICSTARGDTLGLFTTTITSDDYVNGEQVFGPAVGAAPMLVVYRGEDFDSSMHAEASYSVHVNTVATYAYSSYTVPYSGRVVSIGSLASDGSIMGRDAITVVGNVDYSMTINVNQPLPSYVSSNVYIPYLFNSILSASCSTVSVTGVTSDCSALASAIITDNTTGTSDSAQLPISDINAGEDLSQSERQSLAVNAYTGDSISINLETSLFLRGRDWWCPNDSGHGWHECETPEGATGTAQVDPTFEFDQAAFDQEMAQLGEPTFNLSDYFSFSFSPNIPMTTPEPSSLVLSGSALVGMGLAALKKRK